MKSAWGTGWRCTSLQLRKRRFSLASTVAGETPLSLPLSVDVLPPLSKEVQLLLSAPARRKWLLLEAPRRPLQIEASPAYKLYNVVGNVVRRARREHRQQTTFPTATAIVGSMDTTGGIVVAGPGSAITAESVVYGAPPGYYEVEEQLGEITTRKIKRITTRNKRSPRELRRSVSAVQAVESIVHVVDGLDAMSNLSHDHVDRTLRVASMIQRAGAILVAAQDIDADAILPELSRLLTQLLDLPHTVRPDAILTTVLEYLGPLADGPPIDLTIAVAAAKLLAEAALRVDFVEPLPVFTGAPDGMARMQEAFRRLSLTKASTDPATRAGFVHYFDRDILPFLRSELAFAQGMAMYLSYLALEPGVTIRRNVTYWESNTARAHWQNAGTFKLVRTLEQVVNEDAVHHFASMALEFRPCAKFQYWRSTGAGPHEFYVCTTGTTSDGKDFDQLWKQRGTTTGALANADPLGVGHQGTKAVFDAFVRELTAVGATKDSRITITGHSLGAAVALRLTQYLKILGYRSVICCAFSGPGMDRPTFELMNFTAGAENNARDVFLIDDPKDGIPKSGYGTALGLVNKAPHRTGQYVRRGVVDSRFDDFLLGHGTPTLVWRMIAGGYAHTTDQVVEFNRDSSYRFIEYFRSSTAPLIFTQTAEEREMVAYMKRIKEDFARNNIV